MALVHGYVENSEECEMVKSLQMFPDVTSQPLQNGHQQGSSEVWGALLLLQEKLLKGVLGIAPESHFCTNISTELW